MHHEAMRAVVIRENTTFSVSSVSNNVAGSLKREPVAVNKK
jgi:hypothetical protein